MWYFNGELFDEVIEEFDSFVYIIERLNVIEDSTSPIFYIGKKIFFSKSKYKNKRIINESDWWDYYGSSDLLTADVKKYGKENFKRTILHLCRTRGDSGYLEAKEQIERNVLHIDENGFKLYYNKNILGRYRNEPEIYLIDEDIKNYHNDEISGNKVWITNSIQNRMVDKKLARELTENNVWTYGRCEKHLVVNDGIKNYTIPKSQYNKNIHKLGYTKNNEDSFLHKEIGVKNKICINKNNELKWINKNDLDSFIKKSWNIGTGRDTQKLFSVTNDLNQRNFKCENEKNEFLKNNNDWRDGQIHKESFNGSDKVFAKDIRTDEKVSVTNEEYKSNKFLTSIKTKKVKIKMKNRIIFIGYLDLFLIENPQYPRTIFVNALKGDNKINVQKGKYTWVNELNISIHYFEKIK